MEGAHVSIHGCYGRLQTRLYRHLFIGSSLRSLTPAGNKDDILGPDRCSPVEGHFLAFQKKVRAALCVVTATAVHTLPQSLYKHYLLAPKLSV